MVTVAITTQARAQLSELPRPIVRRMEKLLERLADWPEVSGVKHLRGALAGKCRLRTGDYRLQFHVEEMKRTIQIVQMIRGNQVIEEKQELDYAVVVEKIGHRDGFYEE